MTERQTVTFLAYKTKDKYPKSRPDGTAKQVLGHVPGHGWVFARWLGDTWWVRFHNDHEDYLDADEVVAWVDTYNSFTQAVDDFSHRGFES